jgi:hypothetical protein
VKLISRWPLLQKLLKICHLQDITYITLDHIRMRSHRCYEMVVMTSALVGFVVRFFFKFKREANFRRGKKQNNSDNCLCMHICISREDDCVRWSILHSFFNGDQQIPLPPLWIQKVAEICIHFVHRCHHQNFPTLTQAGLILFP